MGDVSDAATNSLPDFDLDYMQYQAQADRPQQYAAGRRCTHDGCKTILSRYNGGETCEVHTAPDYSRYCGYRILICPICSTVRIPQSKTITDPTCQSCRNEARLAEAMGERQRAIALRPDEARCSKCGVVKPATNEFFVIRNRGSRDSECRACASRRQSDYYYLQRYGQTRDEYLEDSA